MSCLLVQNLRTLHCTGRKRQHYGPEIRILSLNTYQELLQRLLVWFGVFALYFSGSESMLDVEGLMVGPAPLFGVGVVGDDSGPQVGSTAVLALLVAVGSTHSTVPGGVNVGGRGASHLERPRHVWSMEFN